jgi:heme O synthase-like polyprenyltransferase
MVTAVRNDRWTRWKIPLAACMLAAAGLTAFLAHLGAVDPWLGGIAVPAIVWFAWVAVDLALAARRRARAQRALR